MVMVEILVMAANGFISPVTEARWPHLCAMAGGEVWPGLKNTYVLLTPLKGVFLLAPRATVRRLFTVCQAFPMSSIPSM